MRHRLYPSQARMHSPVQEASIPLSHKLRIPLKRSLEIRPLRETKMLGPAGISWPWKPRPHERGSEKIKTRNVQQALGFADPELYFEESLLPCSVSSFKVRCTCMVYPENPSSGLASLSRGRFVLYSIHMSVRHIHGVVIIHGAP